MTRANCAARFGIASSSSASGARACPANSSINAATFPPTTTGIANAQRMPSGLSIAVRLNVMWLMSGIQMGCCVEITFAMNWPLPLA